MEIYKFEDVSYWSSNGCSCCEAILMEAWNCKTYSVNGTAHARDECYVKAIEHKLDMTFDGLYYLSEEELQALCKGLGIVVEIGIDENIHI